MIFIPFHTAIIQSETSFVKHFFQLFFVTRDKSLCVSEEKNAVLGKKVCLNGIIPLQNRIIPF